MSMNQFKSTTDFVRCEMETRPRRSQWPNYLCVMATVVTATITLNPDVGQLWSESASPALASVDRVLAPWGASINQYAAPNAPAPTPMIAVVFGCIMPDETVDEVTRAEKMAEWADVPEVGDLKSISRPVHWQLPEGETSYLHDSKEAAERDGVPEVSDQKSISHPIHWRRPEGETSYRHDAEEAAD